MQKENKRLITERTKELLSTGTALTFCFFINQDEKKTKLQTLLNNEIIYNMNGQ